MAIDNYLIDLLEKNLIQGTVDWRLFGIWAESKKLPRDTVTSIKKLTSGKCISPDLAKNISEFIKAQFLYDKNSTEHQINSIFDTFFNSNKLNSAQKRRLLTGLADKNVSDWEKQIKTCINSNNMN